jgi:TetR/AcrR family transcriptional repressor of nem operon
LQLTQSTKQRLLDVGLQLLLKEGYHGLGIQAVLEAAATPKGSFYHHFVDKQDFALQVVDEYMRHVHGGLDACMGDLSRPPLDRVRFFFETTQQKYQEEGYLGCLLGGLGQELAATDDRFRVKIEACLSTIAARAAECLEQARVSGALASDCDTGILANLLVDCWEGAALRSRLRGNPSSLTAMLDFYFRSVGDD